MAHESSFLLCQEDTLLNDYINVTPIRVTNHYEDLFWDNEELNSLFLKENDKKAVLSELKKELEIDEYSRTYAIKWILNVNTYHCFSHKTAVLAVDYLDRFLLGRERLMRERPWMTQLAAVASLSLAAKVEETRVPLLLDLQVEECRYVFEAKTIQRMEILVLSTLEWKMNPVTPLSFIDHFIRRLGFDNQFCCDFLTRCQCAVVSLVSDSRFMRYLPSVLATATMLHIINATYPCFLTEFQKLLNIITINKDELEDCSKLISDSTFLFFRYNSNKRKLRSVAIGSPNGVVDVCFSSDCSNDSWIVATEVSPSPEPISKKIRGTCHEDGVSSR